MVGHYILKVHPQLLPCKPSLFVSASVCMEELCKKQQVGNCTHHFDGVQCMCGMCVCHPSLLLAVFLPPRL